jgi:hypothetical protein
LIDRSVYFINKNQQNCMKQTKNVKKLILNKQTVSLLQVKQLLAIKGGAANSDACTSNVTACGGSCFGGCPTSAGIPDTSNE